MNLKYKILAVLAAGIALTACGGSGTPASTPASSAVPASSHVAEEGVTEPINLLTWTLDDLDDTQTTTFVSASITSGVQNGKLTAKVFSYDLYKKEDIENLAVGDKITFHEEGAAWNQVVNNAVTSIEKNDEYHLVSINGGIEQPGGLDLKLEDENPTIGIILCSDKNNAVVEMTLPEDNTQIFASKYKTVLPSKEALQKLLEEQMADENGGEDDETTI